MQVAFFIDHVLDFSSLCLDDSRHLLFDALASRLVTLESRLDLLHRITQLACHPLLLLLLSLLDLVELKTEMKAFLIKLFKNLSLLLSPLPLVVLEMLQRYLLLEFRNLCQEGLLVSCFTLLSLLVLLLLYFGG